MGRTGVWYHPITKVRTYLGERHRWHQGCVSMTHWKHAHTGLWCDYQLHWAHVSGAHSLTDPVLQTSLAGLHNEMVCQHCLLNLVIRWSFSKHKQLVYKHSVTTIDSTGLNNNLYGMRSPRSIYRISSNKCWSLISAWYKPTLCK